MNLYISIIGAIVAVLVSIIGAILAKNNNIILQTRKLKEEHYIAYIEALHNLAANNNDATTVREYAYMRDKLLLIASEDVIVKLIKFENEAIGKYCEKQDEYLTELYKSIRKDLKLKNKNLPILNLVSYSKIG